VQGVLVLVLVCFIISKFIDFEYNCILSYANKIDLNAKGDTERLIVLNKNLENSSNIEITVPTETKINLGLNEDTNFSSLKDLKSKVRLSNSEKNSYQLSEFLKQVLVGKLLGDAHMRKYNTSENSKSNARIIFLQSLEQSELIYNLYELFKDFTVSPPKVNSSLIKETGNMRHNISFGTRTLPCFNEYFHLFYKDRVKIVPTKIKDIITGLSLAYWIMGDGSWKGYGLRLHTNNFTKDEVELLISSINRKFGFSSSINIANKSKSQYTIYIPSKDIENLRSLVIPYILPSFRHKLGLKNTTLSSDLNDK
jgi:hypothetical protein